MTSLSGSRSSLTWEGYGDRPKHYFPGIVQYNFPMMALEELSPQLLFQLLNMPTHRRVGNVQFVTRFLYALVPCGRLKRS
jgi:hypothetical protein